MAARPGPAQVEALALGPEHVGQRVEDRPQLRLAVALPLDRLRVEAERDVVDEHAPVDLGQVDAALATVDECVEAPTTSSRSTPRSRAKWFRVPAGMQA